MGALDILVAVRPISELCLRPRVDYAGRLSAVDRAGPPASVDGRGPDGTRVQPVGVLDPNQRRRQAGPGGGLCLADLAVSGADGFWRRPKSLWRAWQPGPVGAG